MVTRSTPSTQLGRLSVQLLGAALIVLAAAVTVSVLPGGDDFVDSSTLYRFVAGLAFATTGAGALATAAIAIIRDRERSAFCWLAFLFGLLATVFVLMDALSS